ncbi:hypothetical protein T07_4265 [Trichinella nelsoni]|uniref:Uncharacterized protein n=1 Tax=Trichinella nelsoni TaxID=6336 RepID=A0A0V0S1E5_9BILA|nr:hypothetical protein T07_4265 [Trichinella nelsoni]
MEICNIEKFGIVERQWHFDYGIWLNFKRPTRFVGGYQKKHFKMDAMLDGRNNGDMKFSEL